MVKENQKNNNKESQVNAKAVKESHDEVESLKDDLMAEQLGNNKRKVALMCSLMLNMVFVITAYAILCSDGTGQTFGRLLGVNM